MSYQRAEDILPLELIELLQHYVDGEYLYIPRKLGNKKSWGDNTKIKLELTIRNQEIVNGSKEGLSVLELAEKYYLSEKSIHRILLSEKKTHKNIMKKT